MPGVVQHDAEIGLDALPGHGLAGFLPLLVREGVPHAVDDEAQVAADGAVMDLRHVGAVQGNQPQRLVRPAQAEHVPGEVGVAAVAVHQVHERGGRRTADGVLLQHAAGVLGALGGVDGRHGLHHQVGQLRGEFLEAILGLVGGPLLQGRLGQPDQLRVLGQARRPLHLGPQGGHVGGLEEQSDARAGQRAVGGDLQFFRIDVLLRPRRRAAARRLAPAADELQAISRMKAAARK